MAGNSDNKWYLGKNLGLRRSSLSSPSPSSGRRESLVQNTSKEHGTNHDNRSDGDSPVMISPSNEMYLKSNVHNNMNAIGSVSITLTKFKLIPISGVTVLVTLNDSTYQHIVPDTKIELSTPIEIELRLFDIHSDILFMFVDTSTGTPFGRVIAPLNDFLDSLKPKAPSPGWRQLYPPYKYNDSPDRYRSGYEGVHDYAMSRPTGSLGFVQFSVRVNLEMKPIAYLFLDKYISTSSTNNQEVLSKSSDLIQNEVRLKYLRFQRILTIPPLFQGFFTVPQVFVLVGALLFLSLSISPYQIPFLILACAYFNGKVSSKERSFAHFSQWNSRVVETRLANSRADTLKHADRVMDSGLAQLLDELDRKLGGVTVRIEKWTNLWNFSDAKISFIAYVAAFVSCSILSLSLLIFKARFVFFAVVSSLCVAAALRDGVVDIAMSVSNEEYLKTANVTTVGVKVGSQVRKILNFWSRVPDELEMFHRYVAARACVKENGAEMLDAALAKKSN